MLDCDRLVIPVNLGNQHWVCVVVHLKEKRIEYADSLVRFPK